MTGGKETKESQAPAGGVFFVRCRSEKGCLGGVGLLLFVGKMKIGDVWVQIFLRDGERVDQYVLPLFSDRTMGAYAIRPYPDGQKTGIGGIGRNSIRPTNGHGRARMTPINHPTKQPGTRLPPLVGDV